MPKIAKKEDQVRVLRSGRKVPEFPETTKLEIATRCPRKWISVDMETGEAWAGSASGWRRATAEESKEASDCLGLAES